jgi:hypothetical protein
MIWHMAFHWMPPWHWSMTNAIARKAFNAFDKGLGVEEPSTR